jgi:hypothetical protein
MSNELFEVAFSGQVSDGANVDEVKAKVGKMFNADDAKLAQLFSGKRIVIKKNIDQATANKYKTALNRAGAECEIRSSAAAAGAEPVAAKAPESPATPAVDGKQPVSLEYEAKGGGEVLPPPQVDPLGISGDQIEELSASIAPVGSELQDEVKPVEAPPIDTSGIEIAPVGSDIGTASKEEDPPPPDTTGIKLAD